jgi:hypothetical protein
VHENICQPYCRIVRYTLFFSPFGVQVFHIVTGTTFHVVDTPKHIIYGDTFKRVMKFVPAVCTLGIIFDSADQNGLSPARV